MQRNELSKEYPQGWVETSDQGWNEAESKWEWLTRIDPNPTEGEGWGFTPAQ